MAKRRKALGCPCRVGAKKRACGVKGLRGTVAQHRERAERLLGEARTELADGECMAALSTAAQAEAEAEWLPGGYGPGTIKRKAADLASRARICVADRIGKPARKAPRDPKYCTPPRRIPWEPST